MGTHLHSWVDDKLHWAPVKRLKTPETKVPCLVIAFPESTGQTVSFTKFEKQKTFKKCFNKKTTKTHRHRVKKPPQKNNKWRRAF